MSIPKEVTFDIATTSEIIKHNDGSVKPKYPKITINGTSVPTPQGNTSPTGFQLIVINNTMNLADPAAILANKIFGMYGSNYYQAYTGAYERMATEILTHGDPQHALWLLASFGLDNNMPPTTLFLRYLMTAGAGAVTQNWVTHSDPGSEGNYWVTYPAAYIFIGASQWGYEQGVDVHKQDSNSVAASASLTLNNNVPPSE